MEDILLTEGFELQFENGQLVRGKSTEQHQKLLIITDKGDWRFSPEMGVSARSYLKDDEDNGGLLPELKEQFERDGMTVKELKLLSDRIIVNAEYKNG